MRESAELSKRRAELRGLDSAYKIALQKLDEENAAIDEMIQIVLSFDGASADKASYLMGQLRAIAQQVVGPRNIIEDYERLQRTVKQLEAVETPTDSRSEKSTADIGGLNV